MSNVPMTRPEEMLAFHDGKFTGNAFVGLEGGRVLFSNGTHFSVSADGGVTWSEPYPGLDENGDPLTLTNCSMVNLSGGAIGMATKRTRPGTTRLYESQMVFRRSEDEGRTWSALTLMNHWMLAAHALNDTMIRTQSGRILLPVYFGIGQGGFHQEGAPFPGGYVDGVFVSTSAHFYDPHFTASYVIYSDDEGETWQKNSDGELLIIMEYGGRWELTNEPTLVEYEPGKLLMILRTRLGRMYQAWSEDDGDTWTRPEPTQLAGTQAPAQIRQFPGTGHLLVVWTQQSEAGDQARPDPHPPVDSHQPQSGSHLGTFPEPGIAARGDPRRARPALHGPTRGGLWCAGGRCRMRCRLRRAVAGGIWNVVLPGCACR